MDRCQPSAMTEQWLILKYDPSNNHACYEMKVELLDSDPLICAKVPGSLNDHPGHRLHASIAGGYGVA